MMTGKMMKTTGVSGVMRRTTRTPGRMMMMDGNSSNLKILTKDRMVDLIVSGPP